MRHVLGVPTDVDVRPFLEDEGDELVPGVPQEVLHVNFACEAGEE